MKKKKCMELTNKNQPSANKSNFTPRRSITIDQSTSSSSSNSSGARKRKTTVPKKKKPTKIVQIFGRKYRVRAALIRELKRLEALPDILNTKHLQACTKRLQAHTKRLQARIDLKKCMKSTNKNQPSSGASKRKITVPKKKKPTTIVQISGHEHRIALIREVKRLEARQDILIRNMKLLQAQRNIKRLQTRTDFLMPRIAFARVMREIVVRLQSKMLEALKTAGEMYLTDLFEDCQSCALHAKNITLFVQDIALAGHLCT